MQGQSICSIFAKFYKDLLKNNTVMTVKTSVPTCFYIHGRNLHFGTIMYTIVAQKVTQCFRNDKKPDNRSENPIHNTVCLIIPSLPQMH